MSLADLSAAFCVYLCFWCSLCHSGSSGVLSESSVLFAPICISGRELFVPIWVSSRDLFVSFEVICIELYLCIVSLICGAYRASALLLCTHLDMLRFIFTFWAHHSFAGERITKLPTGSFSFRHHRHCHLPHSYNITLCHNCA